MYFYNIILLIPPFFIWKNGGSHYKETRISWERKGRKNTMNDRNTEFIFKIYC